MRRRRPGHGHDRRAPRLNTADDKRGVRSASALSKLAAPRTRQGKKFCGECGSPLARSCPACGSANPPGQRFCGDCGTQLAAARAAPAPPRPDATPGRRAAAGVGALRRPGRLHHALRGRATPKTCATSSRATSSSRDADRALRRHGREVHRRRGHGRLGHADGDRGRRRAGRSGRARPRRRGSRARRRALQVRAGVLTGEAAVTLGAEGQGMVAGDLVNTASRIQSAAEPGTRARRRVDAARHRGRRSPTRTPARTSSRARPSLSRSSAPSGSSPGGRGALKSAGLEAPFVGRDRELKLIKDLFHASADDGRAQLVSVTGIAGIGKSRLAWEFYKYFDGIVDTVWWHRGRCLAYGEGVAYWALADMVRMRCLHRRGGDRGLGAAEAVARRCTSTCSIRRSARSSSRASRTCSASRTRRGDRQDLFAAWRLFFERLADSSPGGAGLRGHAVGGHEPARLRRVPARVVAQPPALRAHARPPRAARAPPRLGRRPAQLHLALPRAAVADGDGGAARRARARACPSGCASRSSTGPRASRSTPSRPCACCSTAACSSRTAPSTGPPARSRRSRCRRRSTR